MLAESRPLESDAEIGPELSALGSTVIGRLQDPLTWCLIGVVAVLAWQHYRLWQTFLVMVAFAAVNITTMRIWMAADGRSFPTKETWRMFLTLLLIGLAAHGIGYAVSRVRARRLKRAD